MQQTFTGAGTMVKASWRFVALVAAVLPLGTSAAWAARAARPPAVPKLSEATLVPAEVFPEAEAKKFGYGDGATIEYFKTEDGHRWKLTEPVPGDTPGAAADGSAAPAASDFQPLAPTPDDQVFVQEAGKVRPTFVTLVFAVSAEAAASRVQAFFDDKNNEAARPDKLAVFNLDKDSKLSPTAFVYNREFNLGDKQGGIKRGSAVILSRGNVVLIVDACLGLGDGKDAAEYRTLEGRARSVAAYILKKL